MTTSQDKFFKMLEGKASARNFELLVDKSFANQGVLHLQEPGSFETTLSLPFSFRQDGSAYFGWHGGSDKPSVFPARTNPKFAGFEPAELGEAIEAIVSFAGSNRKEHV